MRLASGAWRPCTLRATGRAIKPPRSLPLLSAHSSPSHHPSTLLLLVLYIPATSSPESLFCRSISILFCATRTNFNRSQRRPRVSSIWNPWWLFGASPGLPLRLPHIAVAILAGCLSLY
ncbi:hypothetical protein M011DRAFT_142797 [Sporormia fimetaria CBS 119925]|uniref:Uncharacterized protein n=1 Tax=Sporormia fimetaria CBS 119925 TaxID=1340428 RepID=A0A6A6V6E8_9PLEO|nr:hypothetical protein M011DRAFT_142797 [Sporormia fimetaria CBS 119925]